AGIILLEVLDRAIGLQRDKIVALAHIDEDGMEVVPVCDGIGLLETVGEAGVVKGNAGHALAGERATHLHPRWPVSIGEHRLLEPEPFECAEDVGAERMPAPISRGIPAPVPGRAPRIPCARARAPPPAPRCRHQQLKSAALDRLTLP